MFLIENFLNRSFNDKNKQYDSSSLLLLYFFKMLKKRNGAEMELTQRTLQL